MDIIERLRSVTRLLRETEDESYYQDDTLAIEAADEIERLREALNKIVDKNPFHNQCPPAFDLQYYATTVAEMVAISRAALKEDE